MSALTRRLLLSLSGVALALPSWAAEDFYAGKQIRLLVGTEATGSYNIHARVMAKHMPKHIPGNPVFVVQNMNGAASIKMTNYVVGNAPTDGTVIATGFSTLPTAPLTSPNEATFDSTKLSWIGSATREAYVGYFWHSAPAKTFEDAKKSEVLMGGSAIGTFSTDSALIANELFGTKFKLVIGYKSGAETKMAVEKGEVHGVMGTNWNSLRRETAWFANNRVNLMVQYGLKKGTTYPTDVPLFLDFAKTEADQQLAKFWVANLEHGKPYFGPPGMPADRLAILRKAFDATLKDPEYLKDIEAAGESIESPMTGQELEALVKEEVKTPPSVIQRINKALFEYHKDGNR
jgi:tripartite-type tricarboxylate transporter receptor subunit TctC